MQTFSATYLSVYNEEDDDMLCTVQTLSYTVNGHNFNEFSLKIISNFRVTNYTF